MNEAIEEKRGLGAYLERGREWLQEMGQRGRDQAGHEQDEPDIGFGR